MSLQVTGAGPAQVFAQRSAAGKAGLILLASCLLVIAQSHVAGHQLWWIAMLVVLASFLGGFLRPAVMVMIVLGMAPCLDGILALFSGVDLAVSLQIGPSWIELIFLGLVAGMTVQAARDSRPGPSATGLRLYMTAIGASLLVSLLRIWPHWQDHFGAFLLQAWRSLPYAGQNTPEHTLRAGLLLLAAGLWFWLVRRFMTAPEEQRNAWVAWLVGALVAAVFGLGSWLWTTGSWSSLLEDRNSYASYLVLTLFIAWAVAISDRCWRTRSFATGMLVITVLALLVSGSKMAIFSAFLFTTLLGLAWAWGRGRPVFAVMALSALLALPVLGFLARQLPGRLSVTLVQLTAPRYVSDYIIEYRYPIWSAAGRAFLEQPLLGLGPGLLHRNLGLYYAVPPVSAPSDPGVPVDLEIWQPAQENAHNYFLQLAAETGLLGLLGFVWLVGTTLQAALRSTGSPLDPGRILATGGLAYLATALTGHPLLLWRQVILFWGFLALLSAMRPARTGKRRGWILTEWFAVGVLPLAILVSLWQLPPEQACSGPDGKQDTSVSYDFLTGFYPQESSQGRTWRWMTTTGRMHICNGSGSDLDTTLELQVASFHRDRSLAIYRRGDLVARTRISTTTTSMQVAALHLPPGGTSLIFRADPGQEPVEPVLHNDDLRAVSLMLLGEPRFSYRSSQDGELP